MTLEPVGTEAAAELAVIHARSFETPWSAADIAALLASSGGFGLAVREADRLSGFLIGRAIAGEAEVLTVAVEPAQRRCGLARRLLEAAMAAARAAGAEAMFLEVAADNAGAIGLYEGAGFVHVGVRRGYYARSQRAIDALVLRRELNSRMG